MSPFAKTTANRARIAGAVLLLLVVALTGASGGDVAIAFAVEVAVSSLFAVSMVRHARGPVTQADVDAVASVKVNGKPLACVPMVRQNLGSVLDDEQRKQVAREFGRTSVIMCVSIAVMMSFFVILSQMFGAVSSNPLILGAVLVSACAGSTISYVQWKQNEATTASFSAVANKPLLRAIVLFLMVFVVVILARLFGAPESGSWDYAPSWWPTFVALLFVLAFAAYDNGLASRVFRPSSPSAQAAAPGWYPVEPGVLQWWDGQAWTSYRHPDPNTQ